MTAAHTANTATDSFVGVQAGEIHNSKIYLMSPDAPPRRKYEVGLRYLANGVPSQARALIGEARAHGHDSGEVRFHWVLALLSARSPYVLSPEDRENLSQVSIELDSLPDDEWRRALEVVFGLLRFAEEGGDDTVFKTLDTLPDRQRDQILRHLDAVLTGSAKERLWAEICRKAEQQQTADERTGRVWAYFEPDPIEARSRTVAPADLDGLLPAGLWSAVALAAAGTCWAPLAATGPLPALLLLLVLACGPVAAAAGLRWYSCTQRLRAKEREYGGPRPGASSAGADGFAGRVDSLFRYYSHKYAPASAAEEWLRTTAGVRRALRNEVVEIYRESRIPARRVAWLVRYLVRDVRRRWLSGTLWEYRKRYQVSPTTKLRCVLSLAVAAAAAVALTAAAFPGRPFTTVLTTLLVLAGAWFAVPLWLRIAAEKRRFAEEEEERKRVLNERKAEELRWRRRLEETRPSEGEMQAWLHADLTLLLDAALRHYQLKWHDVIAHFFHLGAAGSCKQRRIERGQWRYSKYEVRIFLITRGGVREAVFLLDFEKADFRCTARKEFSFDSVSSVSVEDEDQKMTMKVALVDGTSQEFSSPRETEDSLLPEETGEEIFERNLDSSGFRQSMLLLEGIGAEGKKWVDRLTERRAVSRLPRQDDSEEPPPAPEALAS